jgi:hypothetical protein
MGGVIFFEEVHRGGGGVVKVGLINEMGGRMK